MARMSVTANGSCFVSQSISIAGDKWSVLVLRELFNGLSDFEEMLMQTGASPETLSDRLDALERKLMVSRQSSQHPTAGSRYYLTEKGKAFFPVLHALRAWGETWCKPESASYAVRLKHSICGNDLGLESFCRHCQVPVAQQDFVPEMSPEWAEERTVRQKHYRKAKGQST